MSKARGSKPNTHKAIEFSPEDRYRVSRLTEEINGRLEDLARIGARVSGIPLTSDTVRKYAPQKTERRAGGLYIEIICSPAGRCGCIVDYGDGHVWWEPDCGAMG
jgi:hypothetical protein